MNNHFYYDVSDLNARWDQVPLQGVGAGILSAGPTGSLGATATPAAMPWKEYSAETARVQGLLNPKLKNEGYCPVDVDGKLGPSTCGALNEVWPEMVPSTCASFTAPKKGPCTAAAPAPSPSPTPSPSPSPSPSPLPSSVSGDNMWLIGGAVAAAAAVGFAFFMKKKKR